MPSLKYDIQFNRSKLAISVSELTNRYLFGVPTIDPKGNSMSEDQLSFYIDAAQKEVENYLSLKLNKQIVEETITYIRSEYVNWGYLPVSYQVNKPISLTGVLGAIEQVKYPTEWLSVKKSSDEADVHRQINLLPTSGVIDRTSLVYSGISPHVGWFGSNHIPNYWTVRYCSGFEQIPPDILNAVGKLASFNVFNILGDLVLGVGIASQSIGIDGLSQSVSTTGSATNAIFGARIVQYQKELKESLPKLKTKYLGHQFMIV